MGTLPARLSLLATGIAVLGAILVTTGTLAVGHAVAGTQVSGADGRLCVAKFLDANKNKRRDKGEPYLPGWRYTVTSGERIVGTLTSKKSAKARACLAVAPGSYAIAETRKPGWKATTALKQSVVVKTGQTATVTFGNATVAPLQNPCDAEAYNGSLPSAAVDVTTGYTNTDNAGAVSQPESPVSTLFPTLNTTLDTFYGQEGGPCAGDTIGGTVPTDAQDPTAGLSDALKQVGITASASSLVTQLGTIGTNLAATVTELPAGFPALPALCGPAAKCTIGGTPPPLDSSKPFGGRDIILVHGLRTGPIFSAIGGNGSAQTTWENPSDRPEFYSPTGYWKHGAYTYWGQFIHRWLKGTYASTTSYQQYSGHATNRYLVVAWPTTERLFVGAHAMLTQIRDAMVSGTGVINETAPGSAGDTGGFCANGCVIISHSTGGPLTDVAMSLAESTKTPGPQQSQFGNVGFIPDHIRAHVALHGAFDGSGMATPLVVAGSALSVGAPLCALVKIVVGWFTGTNPASCTGLPVIPNSVLVDLVPAVMQSLWGAAISTSPVPTLTVAGGHPTSDGIDGNLRLSLIKILFNAGIDDGVLSDDSQCANPNAFLGWPSGYHPVFRPYHANVYDMGVPAGRAIGFYEEQVWDTYIRPLGSQISSACTPWVSTDGMVQPVGFVSHDPTRRYPNHYSFIQSTSDHFIGPLNEQQSGSGAGVYVVTDCYLETANADHVCLGTNGDNNEEIRVITDPFVYQRVCPPGVVDTGQPACAALVNPAVGGLVDREVRGKFISFKLCHHCTRHTLWFWRRAYDRLAGWQAMTENDYVFKYVLR